MGDVADDAYDAALWEDEEPEIEECDCADQAPRDRDWTCPKCDADWPAETQPHDR